MVGLREAIEIVVKADGSAAKREFEKVGAAAKTNLGEAESRSQKMSSSFTKAGIGMVGAAAAIGVGLFHMAKVSSEAQIEHEKLANTIKNMPQLAGASVAAFEKQQKAIQNLTVVDDEATAGIQALLGQFGLTQNQILGLTPLVVDLSRKMGIDTATAAKAVGKAVEGSGGALARFGIKIDVTKGGVDNLSKVMGGLSQKVGGFAQTEGKTFSGRLEILKNQLKDLEEGVGVGVVDAFSKAIGPITSVSKGLAGLSPETQKAAGQFLALGAAGLGIIGTMSLVAGQVVKLRDRLTTVKGEGDDASRSLNGFGKAAGGLVVLTGVVATIGAYKDILWAAKTSAYDAGAAAKEFAASLDVSSTDAATAAVRDLSGALDDWFRANATGTAAEQSGTLLLKNAKVEYADLADAIQGTGSAYDKLVAQYPMLKAGGDQVKESINSLQQAYQSQAQQTLQTLTITGRLSPAVADAAVKLNTGADGSINYAMALYTASHGSQALTDALENSKGALKQADDALRKHASALDKATDATFKLHDAQRAAATGVLDYQDAIANVTDAQKTYNDAVKKNGPNSAEAAQAQRDLQRAYIDVAASTDQAEQNIKASALATAGGKDNTYEYVNALSKLRDGLAPGSPLRKWLDDYIAQLGNIPPTKNTTISVNGKPVNWNPTEGSAHAQGSNGKVWAAGGPAKAGDWGIVGEQGPELVHFGSDARVFSNADSKRMTRPLGGSSGGGGGGGGVTNHYTITVNALDPRAAAPLVMAAIKEHENGNGRGWRKN